MSGAGTQNAGDAMESDSRPPEDGLPGLEQGSYTLEKLVRNSLYLSSVAQPC